MGIGITALLPPAFPEASKMALCTYTAVAVQCAGMHYALVSSITIAARMPDARRQTTDEQPPSRTLQCNITIIIVIIMRIIPTPSTWHCQLPRWHCALCAIQHQHSSWPSLLPAPACTPASAARCRRAPWGHSPARSTGTHRREPSPARRGQH